MTPPEGFKFPDYSVYHPGRVHGKDGFTIDGNVSESLDAGNGGLMLSPTHVLEPEVPAENIVAFFETCDGLKYG